MLCGSRKSLRGTVNEREVAHTNTATRTQNNESLDFAAGGVVWGQVFLPVTLQFVTRLTMLRSGALREWPSPGNNLPSLRRPGRIWFLHEQPTFRSSRKHKDGRYECERSSNRDITGFGRPS